MDQSSRNFPAEIALWALVSLKEKNEEREPVAGIYRVIYKYLINGISALLQSRFVFAIFAVLGGSANKLLRDSAVNKG